jgi:hypothetical protein
MGSKLTAVDNSVINANKAFAAERKTARPLKSNVGWQKKWE